VNVYIVDDMKQNRIILKKFLGAIEDITVEEFGDGIEVVNRMRIGNKKDRYLIFMDIDMPIMNGVDATKNIIKMGYKYVSIVAVSAFNSE